MCVYMNVLEDVSWTKCVFARSNHHGDDDDDDGDGDTPPRESCTHTDIQ